ncbi:MAG: ABC transporter ATP-binding protein [Thermodesulfobacteriota bacterium]
MAFIHAVNLVKKYGRGPAETAALRGVSIEIEQGEFVAVMGPSGSGKSTLLTIMGALNTPTQGSYTIDSLEVYRLDRDRRADFRREYLGFVFQSFHLAPYLTLLENAMLPLAVKRMKASGKRDLARQALARVGLEGKEHRLPSQVSGGEQERAALARAIVNHPPILLADEPTGNLDGGTGLRVMEQLGLLHREGRTIVMVTHSEEYAQFAGRIIRLADGLLAGGGSCPAGEPERTGTASVHLRPDR